NSPANRGLATVYNNGVFFLDKGAAVTDEIITVTPAAGVEQENEKPLLSVNPETKTITVDFTQSGIVELNADKKPAAPRAYDLWGRRVATPRHGVYVVNGRKVRL
ncbi:MAG: hypothetical protein K2J09_00230, partial [Muribaculaceae bacterium]|nr:hypothetical protein [Muribaculaceae bacterium]